MNKLINISGVGILALSVTAAATAQTSERSSDHDAISRLSSDDWCAADLAQDLDAKTALFSENAVLIMPNRTPLEGSESIRAWQEQNYAMASHDCVDRVEIAEASVHGSIAIVRGRFAGTVTMKDGSRTFEQSGNFLNVLERGADDHWRISRMVFTY